VCLREINVKTVKHYVKLWIENVPVFFSDFGPARSVWTGNRTDSMTDRVRSNPTIDIRPVDSNIDRVVARPLATSRPLDNSDSGRIEVSWGSGRPRCQWLV